MSKLRLSAGFIFVILAAVALHAATARAADEDNTLAVYLPVNESMVGSSLTKLLREFCITLGKETGFDVNVEIVPYRYAQDEADMAYTALKEGRADITIFSSAAGYVQIENKVKALATPAFTVTFNKAKYSKQCIYVERGQGIEKISELEGKTWGGTNTIYTRLLLHENGIDKTMSEFFGDTVFVYDSPPSNLVDALSAGEIDCFTADEHQLFVGGGISGGKNSTGEPVELEPVACTQGEHNWIFVLSNNLPSDVVAKLTKRTVNAYKDKAFNKFRFMFMAIKGHFELFDEKDLERTREIVDLIKKNGWDKESDEFHKKSPALPTDEK